MSDVKDLPVNLNEIEKLSRFVRVYKDNTVDGLEAKLDDLGVSYLSADNKGDLVWRYMDHLGMDFSDSKKDRDNTTSTNKDDDNADVENENTAAPQGDAKDDDIDKSSDEHDEPSNDSVKSDESESQDNQSANVDDQTDDVASDNDNAPSTASDNPDASTNEAEQPTAPPTESAATNTPSDNKTEPEQEVEEPEHLAIENKGDFDVYEPATGTLVKAGEITKVYITPRFSRERIMKNIDQYNKSRGKKLFIAD